MKKINLNKNLIFLNEKLKTKNELFSFVAKKAQELNLSKDYNSVFEALWKREKAYATGMMHGFVMPHGIVKNLINSEIMIIKLNLMIDWEMIDSSTPQYAFVLLIREEDYLSGKHMDNLQGISSALIMPKIIEKMQTAKTKEEIYQIFNEN